MPSYVRRILSGSTNGRGIVCTSIVTTSGTIVHTAVSGSASSIDEVWLWGAVIQAEAAAETERNVTIQFGGTNTADQFTVSVGRRTKLICPGFILRNGLEIKAVVTATDNAPQIFGYVNRISTAT